jgi:hypothetical protein
MTGTEIYKRTPAYEAQAREIRLHAPHWKLLLAYDGQRSLSEVALSVEVSFAEALPLTQKFLDEGWIEEQPITLEQYLKRVGAKDILPGAAVPPPTVLHEPGKPTAMASAPVAPAVSAPPAIAPRPPAIQTPPPLPPSTLALTPAEPVSFEVAKAPPLKMEGRAMKLSAVVDFITSLVGNLAIGQILVYRVFLRVPPELLMAEDIASVYLVNDSSLITSEKLQKAIIDAVNAVAKKALPDSVYAAA